jgi:hypothetical protein
MFQFFMFSKDRKFTYFLQTASLKISWGNWNLQILHSNNDICIFFEMFHLWIKILSYKVSFFKKLFYGYRLIFLHAENHKNWKILSGYIQKMLDLISLKFWHNMYYPTVNQLCKYEENWTRDGEWDRVELLP